MRKKVLLVLAVIIFATYSFFVLRKKVELKPTGENLTNYESVYHEYPVVFLRKALDAYLGAIDGKVVNESCIMPSAIDPKTEKVDNSETIVTGLASFDPSYYDSKFIVWWYEDSQIDGKNITIIFRDKPDRLFLAWVGRDSDGEICLLGFNSKEVTDKNKFNKTVKSLKPSIYDEKYGI